LLNNLIKTLPFKEGETLKYSAPMILSTRRLGGLRAARNGVGLYSYLSGVSVKGN